MHEVLRLLKNYEDRKGATVILTIRSDGCGEIRGLSFPPVRNIPFTFTSVEELVEKLSYEIPKHQSRECSA